MRYHIGGQLLAIGLCLMEFTSGCIHRANDADNPGCASRKSYPEYFVDLLASAKHTPDMLQLLSLLFTGLRPAFRWQRDSALENLALRQQLAVLLAVLRRTHKRPRLHHRDRLFWLWLSQMWSGWRQSLLIG